MARMTSSVVAVAALVLAASGVMAAPRTAEEIVADYKAVTNPVLDRSKTEDRAYVMQYMQERQAAEMKRAGLALELFEVDPGNVLVATAMPARWRALAGSPAEGAKVVAEMDGVIAAGKPEALVVAARSTKVRIAFGAMQRGTGTFDEAKVAVDELLKHHGKDPSASGALAQLADLASDEAVKKELQERLLKEFPDSKAAMFMKGEIRQREGVGKPFELAFTEAITGKAMSMADLKGKVVVIDFWATWCGPCIAEMPKMKSMYAEWKDKGVEFIGVSLDQPEDKGGLTALKEFVAKEGIAWPQYYQGNFWDSEFSVSWGINSIPAIFVIDAEGNLHSTDARGKLEKLVPELLAKRDNPAKPAN